MSHLPTRLCSRLFIWHHGRAHSRRGFATASRLLALILRGALLPFAYTHRPHILLAHSELLIKLLVLVLVLSVDKVFHGLFEGTFGLTSRVLITRIPTIIIPSVLLYFYRIISHVDVLEMVIRGKCPLRLVHFSVISKIGHRLE